MNLGFVEIVCVTLVLTSLLDVLNILDSVLMYYPQYVQGGCILHLLEYDHLFWFLVWR